MKEIKKMLLSLVFVLILSVAVLNAIPGQAINVQAAVKISNTKVTLIKGQTTNLKINGTKKKAKWSSSKTSVATVTQSGKVTAKKTGTAKITAKVGNKKYSCTVKVQTPKLNKTKITVTAGKKYTLKLSGTDQKITWKSSKTSVATVNSKGIVTAKKAGIAKITATVLKKKYTCTVTVKKKTTTSQTQNPQDAILSKISKKFSVGRFYHSGWKKVLICTFKNNSGYDLCFNVHFDFDDNSATGTTSFNYFKNGTELVFISDWYEFTKYKVGYTVKKTPDYIKNAYNKINISTLTDENGIVNLKCKNNGLNGFNIEGIIIYYDKFGNIIDYDKTDIGTSGCYDMECEFELPVNNNLDTVSFSKYKTFLQITPD